MAVWSHPITKGGSPMIEKWYPETPEELGDFKDKFCDCCRRDRFLGCVIQNTTEEYWTENAEYPEEWQVDKTGKPVCLEFDES